MRSARFFIISLTMHAALLVYFLALHEWQPARPIAVTILPIEPEISGANRNGGNGRSDSGKTKQAADGATPRTTQTELRVAVPDAVDGSLANPSAVETIGKASETNIAHATARAEITASAGGSSSAGNSAGASGLGSTGTASGVGQGRGSSPSGVITTQARYSDTPKPLYPEYARREGREGRVLLRVWIDDQGKTKSVEVSRSSGSDSLDQAASDAIKRWRFHPARAADKPVESWVNVPIEFKLTDAKN